VPENGETKSIMDALRRGVRSYASRLNSRVRPKTREGHFDETPVPGVCEDYHSGCGKWALAVCPHFPPFCPLYPPTPFLSRCPSPRKQSPALFFQKKVDSQCEFLQGNPLPVQDPPPPLDPPYYYGRHTHDFTTVKIDMLSIISVASRVAHGWHAAFLQFGLHKC